MRKVSLLKLKRNFNKEMNRLPIIVKRGTKPYAVILEITDGTNLNELTLATSHKSPTKESLGSRIKAILLKKVF